MEEPEARVTSPLFMLEKRFKKAPINTPDFALARGLDIEKKSRIYAKFGFENPLVPQR
jgi:hypothetical protein